MIPDYCPQRRRTAFTLVEMLTTVAVLVIVLGLMVSLARHVRERAALALTKNLLRQLDGTMARYADRAGGALPPVGAFPPVGWTPPDQVGGSATGPAADAAGGRRGTPFTPRSAELATAALTNSRDFVAALRSEPGVASGTLAEVPESVYDGITLRDAWGSPIVFMPTKHPLVGTAPRDKVFFFFSAGPDRDYLSQEDNLYSYEEVAGSGR